MKGFGKSPTKDGSTTTTTTGRPSGRLWSSVRTKLSIIPKKRSTSPTSKIPSRSASLRTARNKLGVTEVVHSIQSAPHSPVIAGEPTTDPAVDALAPITAEEKPQNPPTLLEVYQELVQKNEERRNSEEAAAAATPPEKVSKESAMALRAYVQSLEEKYKDQPHKLDIDGREIIWRDYVNKVERLLVIVGHVAGTFTTSPNPTVWSAINVLIKTDVTQCEDFAAILGCVEKALDILRRGSTYEEVYLQEGADTRAAGDLKSGVTALYETVAELLTRARGRLDEGQGKQLLRTLIDGDDSYEVLKRVQNKERDLDRAVQACDAELTTQQRAILKKLEEPVRRVDSSVEYSLEVVDSRECRKTLEYISNIEIGRHHAENSQKRTKGTCEWLLKKPEYVQWQGSSWSSILWLKGHAGAGKSLLVSRVVDQFVEELVDKLAPQDDEHKREMHHEGFAYFYCHRSISDGRNTKKILHSLIRQLASTRGNSGKIHKELRLRFKKARLEKKGFSEQECWHILKKFVNTYPRTTLVLDALNECKKQDRRMLIEGLHSLVNESERPVKVLIASRPEVDIRDNLFHPDLVEVEAAGNTDDIATYIEDEIGKHRQNGMWRTVSPELQQDVVRTVRSKSNGIWAYLQWEELKRVEDASEVQSRLAKLPKGLSNTYDEMCNALGSDNLGILERAIKWVYCAPIPLSSEILLAAIRMDHSSTDERVHLTQRYPVKESDFERICHNFIIKDSASKWKFAHASVIDYFEETRKDFSIKAPKDVASILLQALIDCYSKVELPQANNALETLLEKEQEVEGEDNCLFVNHPFMKWAESTWVDYVHQTSTESTRVPKLLQTFLGLGDSAGPGSPYQIWCRVYCMRPSRRSYTSQDFEPWGNVAFGICTFGLDQHIGTEWEKLIPTSGVNYSGLNLLEVAAKNKRFALCRKLLKLDEVLVKSPGFALEISLEHSDARTLKALLAGGVDPNMLMRGCRGLCYAASGELSLTEELLNAGANPQLPCSDTCTTRYPLIRASWCGNYETVDLLVKKGGADVNLRLKAGEAGVYGNALVAAVAAGELDTAKMLVSQHGARPNGHIEYGHYRSVLAAAVLGDCHSFVVVDRPRTFEQMMRWLVAEAGLDMSPQSLTPPLGKPSQGALFTAVRGKGDELTRRARYLMSQYGVEAEVVGRIGFDENVRFQSARKHGDRHLSC